MYVELIVLIIQILNKFHAAVLVVILTIAFLIASRQMLLGLLFITKVIINSISTVLLLVTILITLILNA